MNIFTALSYVVFALIDIFCFEVILSLIFRVDNHGGIKFTFDGGLSQYRKTSLFVIVFLTVALIAFVISNLIQGWAISFLSGLKFKLIPLLIMLFGLSIFWITKVILGRKWKFPLVIISILLSLVGLLILILTYLG